MLTSSDAKSIEEDLTLSEKGRLLASVYRLVWVGLLLLSSTGYAVSLPSIEDAVAVGGANTANVTNYHITEIFQPVNASDLSLRILSLLFGRVGNALDSKHTGLPSDATSIPLMQTLFTVFNTGLIILVSVVVLYATLFSTISISQDGQGMARKDGPLGVLRMTIGSVALIPGFDGYSAVQVLVMTLVVYGVNFANYMWLHVTENFVVTGTNSASSTFSANTLNDSQRQFATGSNILDASAPTSHCSASGAQHLTSVDLLAMAVCAQIKQTIADTGTSPQPYGSRLQMPGDNNCFQPSGSYAICFGRTDDVSLIPECGVFTLPSSQALLVMSTVTDDALAVAKNYVSMNLKEHFTDNPGSESNSGVLTRMGSRKFSGCGPVMLADPSRFEAICTPTGDDAAECGTCVPPDGKRATTATQATLTLNALYKNGGQCSGYCLIGQDLNRIGTTFVNVLNASGAMASSADSSSSDVDTTAMARLGWASAGQYFFQLSGLLSGHRLDSGSSAGGQLLGTIPSTVAGNINNPLCRQTTSNGGGWTGMHRLGQFPCCVDQTLQDQWVRFYNTVFPTATNLPYMSYYAWLNVPANTSQPSSGNMCVAREPSLVSSPACRSAQFVAAAGDQFMDLPEWMRMANPTLGFITTNTSALGSNNRILQSVMRFINRIPTGNLVSLTWGLSNMVQSMYMAIEGLTGLRIFTHPIHSRSDYTSKSNSVNRASLLEGVFDRRAVMYDGWCKCVLQSFRCGGDGGEKTQFSLDQLSSCARGNISGSEAFIGLFTGSPSWGQLMGDGRNRNVVDGWSDWVGVLRSGAIGSRACSGSSSGSASSSQSYVNADFFGTMQMAGCLNLGMEGRGDDMTTFTYERSGLFGMAFLKHNGFSSSIDPLGALVGVGRTMLQASVFYFLVTMQNIFSSTVDLASQMVIVWGGIKVLAGVFTVTAPPGVAALITGGMTLIDSLNQSFFELSKVALEVFLPLGSAVAGLLFVQGIILGLYLPFLAFFYFLFGVIGWLLSVVEAMIAAPLVALGVTHPEGHDLLGQAEQSTMLLLSVFIRPVAMIAGLFFALVLSQAALGLVNEGFLYIISEFYESLIASMGGSMTNPLSGSGMDSIVAKVIIIATLGLFMVYSYAAYAILEMSYSLIYQIPDRLLRWIGGQDDGVGRQASQSVSAIKSDTQGAADSGGRAMGEASSSRPEVSLGRQSFDMERKQDEGNESRLEHEGDGKPGQQGVIGGNGQGHIGGGDAGTMSAGQVGGPGGANPDGPDGGANHGGPDGGANHGGPDGGANHGGPDGGANHGGPDGGANHGGT